MFSSRVPEPHSLNPLSLLIEECRAAGAPILDLTESNPTRCGFQYDAEGISRGLALPASLVYEPHPQGIPATRAAIASYYAEQGVSVDPDMLFLTSGTSEAYGHLFTLLADPGDEVLVPTPGYPLLEVLTGLDGVRRVHYPLARDASGIWRIDTERLRNTISTRTRAIAVVSPNNPTGSFLKKRERGAIEELCRQHDLALIVDEVFSDYGRAPDPERCATAAGPAGALTFVLNGLSKMAGLPQMKLAWIHVGGPAELRVRAAERLAFVTDAYLSVGAPIQHAAPAILRQRSLIQGQIRQRLEENSRTLERLVTGGPARVLPREGGWYAVLRLEGETADEDVAIGLLKREGVLVHPGYFYDFPSPGYLVMSLLPRVDVFREGVARLASGLVDFQA
jgi:aspartate/methionine/tyrosine aminotransferase